MAKEDKSFADLVQEAPAAAAEATVSLVGTLAKSSEAGKFVLALQDGRLVTLETSAVKGHAVLGSSLGRTIVRIEVESGKVPAPASPFAVGPLMMNTGLLDHPPMTYGWLDTSPLWDAGTTDFWFDVAQPYGAGAAAPFAMATPHQAPANVLAALSPSGVVSHMRKLPGVAEHTYPPLDVTGTSYWGDVTIGAADVW